MADPDTPEPDAFQVGPDTHVTLEYDLYDAEGDLVESSAVTSPLELIFGYGQIPPRLETAIEGGQPGEHVSVELEENEAYGGRDPEAIVPFDRSDFPPDIEVGDELEAEDDGGEVIFLKVIEVGDEVVVADTNHPLSGQRVRLDLRIEAVRPATGDEIAKSLQLLMDSGLTGAQGGVIGPGGLVPAARLIRGSRTGYESS